MKKAGFFYSPEKTSSEMEEGKNTLPAFYEPSMTPALRRHDDFPVELVKGLFPARRFRPKMPLFRALGRVPSWRFKPEVPQNREIDFGLSMRRRPRPPALHRVGRTPQDYDPSALPGLRRKPMMPVRRNRGFAPIKRPIPALPVPSLQIGSRLPAIRPPARTPATID
ncbi:MAG: hypothetical protein LBF22_11880 [Deltaproteobacteria bacterium]|nr:hypothetical protein [Deltaproteobacteria bacterium]